MSYSHGPEAYLPFPEVPAGARAPYRIHNSDWVPGLPTSGMTDKQARELYVPLRREERAVRRHEMAHVRWSPSKLPRVRFNPHALMAVEDARINCGLARIGLDLEFHEELRAQVEEIAAAELERGDLASVVLRTVASMGTNAERDLLGFVARKDKGHFQFVAHLVGSVHDKLERSRKRAGGNVAGFAAAHRTARWLARELEGHGEGSFGGTSSQRGPVVCGHCVISPGGASRRAAARRRVPGTIFDDLDELLGGIRGTAADGWRPLMPGTMSIATAPLTRLRMQPGSGSGRGYRPAEEGSVTRYMHRLTIDGAIFRRPARRRGGGTVLIDVSGSMRLTSEDVDRIIAESPSATLVAIYSGKGSAGELRIVVRGGRRAAPEHLARYGKGNIVDVPALEWLERQRAPRVWISDGGVTGIDDAHCPTLKKWAERICERARIARVATATEAARALAGRGKPA